MKNTMMTFEMNITEKLVYKVLLEGPCSASYISRSVKISAARVATGIAGIRDLGYIIGLYRGIYTIEE